MTTPSPTPRVAWLALDAADPGLVLEWSRAGHLPVLAQLLDSGIRGAVRTDPGLYTGSIWPSLTTGVNPGRHGVYFCEQLRVGSYDTIPADGRDFCERPFWEALSRAGRRVAIVDVPKAPLAPTLDGVQVVDWATHDAEIPTCTQPPELLDELRRRDGGEPLMRCDFLFRGNDPEATLLASLERRIERKTRLGVDLLKQGGWDLFAFVLGESHCVGHQCWHVHDPAHPAHDPAVLARLGDPLLVVYQRLDAALGELLAQLGPETTTIVLLSHGMGPHYDGTFLLDDLLRRLEGRGTPASHRVLLLARELWRRLPVKFTEALGGPAGRFYRDARAPERAARRAFAVPTNSNAGGIRINLRGREPAGRVDPGAEFDATCADLAEGLLELRDPDTGTRLVKEVLRSRDLFHGDALDRLPDLIVRWHRERPIRGASSERAGLVTGRDTETLRSGDHRPGGLFVARGPGLASGSESAPVATQDFAPTIASLLGVELAHLDGSTIAALVPAPTERG